jgi:hypothetical protein
MRAEAFQPPYIHSRVHLEHHDEQLSVKVDASQNGTWRNG